MKRAKEDAELTKNQIMEAAFSCFYEKGFQDSTLEQIAECAGLTRGAIYWHFKDKTELYKAVVEEALSDADVVSYAYSQGDVSLRERLYEVFWFAQNSGRKIEFIYKTLNFISQNSQFEDLLEKLKYEKIKLFRYFAEEIRIHAGNLENQIYDAEDYAASLFLQFEGLFLTKNIPVGVSTIRPQIEKYVDIIVKDIL